MHFDQLSLLEHFLCQTRADWDVLGVYDVSDEVLEAGKAQIEELCCQVIVLRLPDGGVVELERLRELNVSSHDALLGKHGTTIGEGEHSEDSV